MRPTTWRVALAAILALMLAVPPVVTPTPTAHAAATFTVNDGPDEPDANPGDGICAVASTARCTLRAAVMEANAVPGADTILLPPPAATYGLTRLAGAPPINGSDEDTGAFDDLDLRDDVTIKTVNTSATITIGTGQLRFSRIFHIQPGVHATLEGLTISGGQSATGNGGGILNQGTLTMRSMSLTNSRSPTAGGGLANQGVATWIVGGVTENSVFSGGKGGGVYNAPGARLTLDRVHFSSNRASGLVGAGGGLWNAGVVEAIDAAFWENRASDDAGAVFNEGTLTLERAVVQGNVSNEKVGGIENWGTATLTNATLLVNSATTSAAGGVSAGALLNRAGTTTLRHVTFGDNTSPDGGRSVANSSGQIVARATIFGAPGGNNCLGSITSQGFNIDAGDTCALSGEGDLSNTDPQLTLYGEDNAEEWKTRDMALGPWLTPATGSPAVDRVPTQGCPATDQRTVRRPLDANGDRQSLCDTGAVERAGPPGSVAVFCDPRQPVHLAVTAGQPGTLIATLATTWPRGSSANRLRQLRFGQIQNASVEIDGQTGITSGTTVNLPYGMSTLRLTVRRGPNGAAATVPLVVVSDCGEWATLVGGGLNAWGGPSTGTAVSTPSVAAPPAPTPAASSSPRIAAPSPVEPSPVAACAPRPPVGVKTRADGPGRLQVTVSAGRGGLTRLTLGAMANAAVDVGGQISLGSGAVVPLAGAPKQVTLLVRQLAPNQPVNVPLTITDGCGAWQTLVGTGPNAPQGNR